MRYNVAILIPCHNEEKNIEILYQKLISSFNQLTKKVKNYSIYFINDGSTDHTKSEIKKLCKKYVSVKLIDLKRKFGKSIALQIGFSVIEEDIDLVFMMDGDLQDDPKEIGRFIEKIEEGYDLVSGYKKVRLDNIEKRTASKVYNKVLNITFKMNLHDHNCGFKCFKRKVLNDIKIYDNLHRFITIFANSKGYKVGEIEVEHHKRKHGKSKYGLTRYFVGFKDMIRVKFIISHKNVYSFIKDIVILGIILGILFVLNRVLFLIVFLLLVLIYCLLIYNLNRYQKFKIDMNKTNELFDVI